MIRIQRHANFQSWFNLLKGHTLIEQISGEAKALDRAKKLSRGKTISIEYETPHATPLNYRIF